MIAAVCALGSVLGVPAGALAAEAPKVEEQWVTDVSATSATLQAKVNPGGAAATYRFEYATSEAVLLAGHGERIPMPPTPEGEVGAGEAGVVVEVYPEDLAAGTDYWYRVVATNGDGATPGCQVPGSCQSFTTQTTGSELVLPDNREWELVSPPPGDNGATGQIVPYEGYGGQTQAAADGDAITYLAIGSVESGPPASAGETQVLSVHGAGGWSSRVIATPHQVSAGIVLDAGDEYRFFTPDLSIGFVEPKGTGTEGEESLGAAPLSEAASENARTVYLRADAQLSPEASEQGTYDEAAAEGGYKPLVTSKAGYANVPLGTEFGGDLRFAGASPDGSHAVFSSNVPLTEMTPDGKYKNEGYGLYEWAGGQLQLVSVLPNGEQEHGGSLGTDNDDDARGAVSNDGRVLWSVSEGGEAQIYLRDVSSERTVQVSAPEAGAPGGEGSAVFQFANSDGSRVFFTDTERLTENSTASRRQEDLYECEVVEVAGELSCKLSDLTVDPGGHAGVQGQVFASDNDSYVYFVARGVLAAGAEQGRCEGEGFTYERCNLYVEHYDEAAGTWEAPVFIAALSGGDVPDWVPGIIPALTSITSRVSPNGEYFEFMSERSLTGYDNRDAGSGEPDQEVFLYDARSNRVVCVSCNPTGERPDGVHEPQGGPALLIDPERVWSTHRGGLAADVPGWVPMETDSARYQPRYLSDSGRLFFDSPDALVPQATNGLSDVYEYEPVGVGSCEASSVTFNASSGGCVGLISSGTSGEEAKFWDASENGDDVFFITHAQLVSADRGTGFAVYDAHVCSAASPCSAAAVLPPACTTTDACRAAQAIQPSLFGAPSSATFSGAGNVVPEVVKPGPRSLTRAQKLARALKACRGKPRRRRAVCEAKARRTYGAVRSSRRSEKGGK